MRIIFNGKEEEVKEKIDLKQFLESKSINPNVVACELNLQVIRRKDLGSTELKNGDTLEVIRMIGGG